MSDNLHLLVLNKREIAESLIELEKTPGRDPRGSRPGVQR
jgi:hypothetical protein